MSNDLIEVKYKDDTYRSKKHRTTSVFVAMGDARATGMC